MSFIKYKHRKNIMNRFKEKFINVDFGPLNAPFTLLGIIKIFVKKLNPN